MNTRDATEIFVEYGQGRAHTTGHSPCYMNHPALDVGPWKIYGGSCAHPIVENGDIYVGLDSSRRQVSHYPWNGDPKVIDVFFPIADGTAPKDVAEFKKMVTWLALKLKAGKLIHVGCIGGHGRTGLVLAALVKEVTGNVDAIQYVRDHYCKKAVESSSQVLFLFNEYGITQVAGSRGNLVETRNRSGAKWTRSSGMSSPEFAWANHLSKKDGLKGAPTPLVFRPSFPNRPVVAELSDTGNAVWVGSPIKFDKLSKSVKIETSQKGG